MANRTTPAAPAEQKDVAPPYGITMVEIMEVEEGERGEFDLQVWVPEPGQALVTFEGLPSGARYLEDKGKLIWTPPYDAANTEADPQKMMRAYPVKVVLRSSEDPITHISRSAVIVVKNKPRQFEVKIEGGDQEFYELDNFVQEIKVISSDFPQGRFFIAPTTDGQPGMPKGATLTESKDGSVYVARFRPPIDLVRSRYQKKEFLLSFEVVNQFGERIQSESVKWTVFDRYARPSFTGPFYNPNGGSPVVLNGEEQINFTLMAQDANGEKPPLIRLKPGVKIEAGGVPKLTPQKSKGAVSIVQVQWVPQKTGQFSQKLEFEACARPNGREVEEEACTSSQVSVDMNSTGLMAAALPPVFDRSKWPLGTRKTVDSNKPLSIPVTVSNPNDPAQAVPIEATVYPAQEEGKEDIVMWKDGKLSFKGTVGGFRQIILKATTEQGTVQIEPFALEVTQTVSEDEEGEENH